MAVSLLLQWNLHCIVSVAHAAPSNGIAERSIRVQSPHNLDIEVAVEKPIAKQKAHSSIVGTVDSKGRVSVSGGVAECPATWLYCDGRCVSSSAHCDGKMDCSDGSDEKHCEGVWGRLQPQYTLQMLKVPNHMPPPRDTYQAFYENPIAFINELPRVSNNMDTEYHVDVFHLAAPISNQMMADQGYTHDGIGFVVKQKRTTGDFQELFRLDLQYWAAMFNYTSGPVFDNEQGKFDLVNNRLQWRNRGLVSLVLSIGEWDKYWHEARLLGSTNGTGFNRAMEYSENWANTRKYFLPYWVMKDGKVLMPASTCEEFILQLCTDVFSWDIGPLVNFQSAYVHVYAFKAANFRDNAEDILEPYYEYLTNSQNASASEDSIFNKIMFRHLSKLQNYRFQWEMSWALPLWFGEDGKPFEASDVPENYGLMSVHKIEVVRTGAKVWSAEFLPSKSRAKYVRESHVNAIETAKEVKDHS